MILIKDKQLLYKIIRHGPERLVLPIWARLSRDSALRWLYKRRMGVMLNYDNPQTFSEKIQWMKVFWDHPLKVKCADKFCVREYVTECGCEEILVDMLGVYENPDEIDFNSLPERFVLTPCVRIVVVGSSVKYS